MSTRDLILASFKRLFSKEPYSKITVAEICEGAYVSRKTFYFHFDGKKDLVRQIIHDDFICPLMELRGLLPTSTLKSAPKILVDQIHDTVFSNRDFYERLVMQMSKCELLDIMANELAEVNYQALAKSKRPKIELEYKAYFYASSHSLLIIKWIQDKFPVSAHELTCYFYKWALNSWPGNDDTFIRWEDTKKPASQ